MSETADAVQTYYFLSLVNRVAGDDASIRRRVDALTPDERAAVAREVIPYANSMDNDDTGRYLIKEAIRRALP